MFKNIVNSKLSNGLIMIISGLVTLKIGLSIYSWLMLNYKPNILP